jgi:FkbM family methyltransferase
MRRHTHFRQSAFRRRMPLKLRYLYRAYRYRYRVDPAELRFLCAHVQPGQVAVDIGCHKGAYAYWMRRRVGPDGAVYAFEPQPRQVNYLRNVFSTMRYDNVTVVPMAVSNTCGKLPLHIRHGAGTTHAATLSDNVGGVSDADFTPPNGSPANVIPVDVTTLDAFFANKPRAPHFLKIDVEGHELAVFEGARRTLEMHRPTILVECEARHRPDGDVRPVFDLLRSHGYDGSFFSNGRRCPIAHFDAEIHQKIDPGRESPQRRYVNNFAFVPASH